MENAGNIKESILEDLTMIRLENFRHNITKKNEKFLKELDVVGDKLWKYVEENIKEVNIREDIVNKLDDLLSEITGEQNFWDIIYYKEGITDAICYKQYLFDELEINIFEKKILNKTKEKLNKNECKEQLVNFINEKVKNETIKKNILAEIKKIIQYSDKEKIFWRKKFYRKGYSELQQLISEAKQYKLN